MGSREQQELAEKLCDCADRTLNGRARELANELREALAQPDTLRERLEGLLSLIPKPDEYFYVEHRGSGLNYRGAELRFVIDRRGSAHEGKSSYDNEDINEWMKKLAKAALLASAPAPDVRPPAHEVSFLMLTSTVGEGGIPVRERDERDKLAHQSGEHRADRNQTSAPPAPPVGARARYEEWRNSRWAGLGYVRNLDNDLWDGWQAAEQAAMERACAEIEYQAGLQRNSDIEIFLVSLAAKIRAFASPAAAAQREPEL
jgi:hypothetical protein